MTLFKGNNDSNMGLFEEQTCSRLKKCSFTAFPLVVKYPSRDTSSHLRTPRSHTSMYAPVVIYARSSSDARLFTTIKAGNVKLPAFNIEVRA